MSRPGPAFRPHPSMETRSQPRWWWYSPWLPAVLGCICYLNSLPNDLVYDDEGAVAGNPRIRSLTDFRAIWLTDWWKPVGDSEAWLSPHHDLLYRPFTLFSLAADYALHGLRPWGFRLFNVLLHGVVCVLVWHFARRLFEDDALATWSALLFAVHPIHCEAVVYIVGRAEQWVAALTLAGLLVLVPARGPTSARRALWAAAVFFLALLSKESAIAYIPVALIVLHALRARLGITRAAQWLMHAGILLVPFVAYLPLRYVVLGSHLTRGSHFALLNPLAGATAGERMIGVFTILGHYTRLLVWPWKLSADYGCAVIYPQAGPDAMTGLGAVTAIGLVVGLLGYTRGGGTWRRTAVLCAVFVASYALISNALLIIGTAAAERLMYWPSVPALMLMALAGVALSRRAAAALSDGRPVRATAVVVGLILIGLLGARGVARNRDWATSLRLFTTDATTYPQSAQLCANAGTDCFALAQRTQDAGQKQREAERAEAYYSQALRAFPKHWGFLLARSEIRAALGNLEGAITDVRLACTGHPGDPILLGRLGMLLGAAGQFEEAATCLEQATHLAPDRLDYELQWAAALKASNQVERAIGVLKDLAQRDPKNFAVRLALTTELLERDPAAALRYASEAHALQPDDVQMQLMQAEALVVSGQTADGIARYEQIRDQLPASDPRVGQINQRLQALATTTAPSQPATRP